MFAFLCITARQADRAYNMGGSAPVSRVDIAEQYHLDKEGDITHRSVVQSSRYFDGHLQTRGIDESQVFGYGYDCGVHVSEAKLNFQI